MALDIYSNNYTRWVHPNNEYSRELRLQKRFANVSGKSSDQMAIVQKKAELETLLRTPPVNAATKERLLREIGDLIAAKRAKHTANMAARFTKLTGRRVLPVISQVSPLLNNSPVNARSNVGKIYAYLARLQKEAPPNVKEIARVQQLLPVISSTSFGSYPLPDHPVRSGGRSRRLKSKRNKRTRRHVR